MKKTLFIVFFALSSLLLFAQTDEELFGSSDDDFFEGDGIEELAVEEKGDIAVKELRKHISWYTKNMANSTDFRSSINKIESKEELITKIDEYFK